jgi:hypothetical protein
MMNTLTKKLPKPVTGYSNKRTIVEAFRDTFKRFKDSKTIVLSYGSNALPSKETITTLLLEVKQSVEVRAIPHIYHYGTHQAAARRSVDEYIFIGSSKYAGMRLLLEYCAWWCRVTVCGVIRVSRRRGSPRLLRSWGLS